MFSSPSRIHRMYVIDVVILSWLLVAGCVGSLCGSGPVCRISTWDLRSVAGGFNLLEQEPSGRYLTIQIQHLSIGATPMADLLVNVSKITDALLFKTFHESTVLLASALTLKELVLHNANELREFTARSNAYLQRLEVESCAMTVTPPSVRNLVKLRDLTVNGCQIKWFNLALLANLRQLETVGFVGNQITNIYPPQAGVEQTIGALDLSRNKLRYLNLTALASLKQLRTLRMAKNNLTEVGYALRGGAVAFPRLETLDLSHNVLRSLSLAQLSAPRLAHLQLSFNELSTVPGPLQRFPRLVTLALSHNALSSVSLALFEGLRDLVSLELAQNRLHTLDAPRAVQLPRLESLLLSDNRLRGVNLQKLAAPRLRTLDLSFNLLTDVPLVFANPGNSLQLVNVMGNPVSCATLETNRAYIRKKILVPKWLVSGAELCSTGRLFVLDAFHRACCTP